MCLHAGSQPQAAPDPWGSHSGPSLGLGTRATVGLGVLRLLCWWRRAVNGRAGVRGGNGRRGWGGRKEALEGAGWRRALAVVWGGSRCLELSPRSTHLPLARAPLPVSLSKVLGIYQRRALGSKKNHQVLSANNSLLLFAVIHLHERGWVFADTFLLGN